MFLSTSLGKFHEQQKTPPEKDNEKAKRAAAKKEKVKKKEDEAAKKKKAEEESRAAQQAREAKQRKEEKEDREQEEAAAQALRNTNSKWKPQQLHDEVKLRLGQQEAFRTATRRKFAIQRAALVELEPQLAGWKPDLLFRSSEDNKPVFVEVVTVERQDKGKENKSAKSLWAGKLATKDKQTAKKYEENLHVFAVYSKQDKKVRAFHRPAGQWLMFFESDL